MRSNGDYNLDRKYASWGNASSSSNQHKDDEDRALANIRSIGKNQNEYYKRSLLHPMLYPNAKIPTLMPDETATAQLMYNTNITVDANGNFLLIYDPTYETMSNYQTTVTGTGSTGAVTNFLLTQDSNVIDMWRLVSSEITLRYTGRLDYVSGFLCGAQTSNLSNANDTIFKTFSNIEDLQNKEIVMPLDGIKLIYFPRDTTFTDYTTLTSYTGGTSTARWKFCMVVYGTGLPVGSTFRVDICRNIEYVAKTTYREYIPHTAAASCQIDPSILNEVRDRAVQSLSNTVNNQLRSKSKAISPFITQAMDALNPAMSGLIQAGTNYLNNNYFLPIIK